MNLIYTDSNEFNRCSWERIVHSIVTFGKVIWVNENITFSNQIPDWLRGHYIKTFHELKEAKIIKLWNYELLGKTTSQIDRIISIDESSTLYDVINKEIEEYVPLGTLSQKDITGNEITSKIIQYKHELWNIGIADILKVDGICYPHSNNVKKGIISDYYKYESIYKKYTEYIFRKLEIKPLGFLPTKDILELQKQSKIFSKQLLPLINNKLLNLSPDDETIESDCGDLFKIYEQSINELITEKSLRFGKKFLYDAIFTIGGLLFSPISLVPLGSNILSYFKNKRKNPLFLLTMSIKNRAYMAYMNKAEKNKEVIQYFDTPSTDK